VERRFITRIWVLPAGVLSIALLAAAPAGQTPAAKEAGQAPAAKDGGKDWTAPKTPWGHPDLQGMWDSRSGVPMERAADFGSREFMTEQEAIDRRKRGLDNAASGEDEEDVADSLVKQDEQRYSNADKPDDGRPGYRIAGAEYNAFWSADPTRPRMSLRTSRIVDPPDGKLPPITREALTRWQARHEARKGRSQADSWEDRNPMERCLMRPGLPMGEIVGTNQFSVVEIVQDPNTVAIIMPYGYPRLVRLGNAQHAGPSIRQWNGDSVGRWEGQTLVVETTNFNRKQDGGPVMTVRRPTVFYPGSGETLRLVERFTPTDAKTLEYRYTVEDPHVFVKPWTAVVEFSRDSWNAEGKQDRIFEYACHEHNYGMLNALKGARADRKQAVDEELREEKGRVKDLAAKWNYLKTWEAANASPR
jgi:hypothetical protein